MGAESENVVTPRFVLIVYVIVVLVYYALLLSSRCVNCSDPFRPEERTMALVIMFCQAFIAFLQVALALGGKENAAMFIGALFTGIHLLAIIIYVLVLGVRYLGTYVAPYLAEVGQALASFGHALWVPASFATLIVSTAVAVMCWRDPRTSSVATFFAFVALLALLTTLI